jgi:hypothetical protein
MPNIKTGIQKDIQRGNDGEKLVASLLSDLGIKYEFVDKENREFYDIIFWLDRKKYKIEIKYDYFQKKSGNFAIEVFNTYAKKKSGLSITKSNLWIHILDEQTMLITHTSKLKDFCRKNKPAKIIERGGDKNARLWLYPSSSIIGIFKNISGITLENFKIIIQ